MRSMVSSIPWKPAKAGYERIVRFKKIRPRRGSLAVSIISGSPIAANNLSAALAYFIGSPRHDSRYSAIDMSVSLRASKDLANALNRESLYMNPSPRLVGCTAGRASYSCIIGVLPAANQHQHMNVLDTRLTL